ncbi:hypothetical protein ADK87_04725 [Streptomyces sp. NRRL F-4711]|nr:hypothetical protein ADK87_04725 [Streptomyces sp. NRRL F-4711]
MVRWLFLGARGSATKLVADLVLSLRSLPVVCDFGARFRAPATILAFPDAPIRFRPMRSGYGIEGLTGRGGRR